MNKLAWMSKFSPETLAAFQQRFRASEKTGDGGGAMLKPVHSNPKLPWVQGRDFLEMMYLDVETLPLLQDPIQGLYRACISLCLTYNWSKVPATSY